MLASPVIPILLAVTLAAGCLPGAFDELRGDGHSDAVADAGLDASAEEDAGEVAEDAAVPDASEPDAGPRTEKFIVSDDRDDGIFCIISGDLDEKLHFSPDDGAAGNTIEVGVDSEQCRTGLRFVLPLAAGAKVESATLTLYRVGPEDNVTPTATMTVQVYESSAVPQFDDGHQHDTPANHSPDGKLWTTEVNGWQVGPTDAATTSPELKDLVQHTIDGTAWQAGAAVTFLLSPDAMTGNEYAQFQDSYEMDERPVLTLIYR